MLNKRIKTNILKMVVIAVIAFTSFLGFKTLSGETKPTQDENSLKIVDVRNNITEDDIISKEIIIQELKKSIRSEVATAKVSSSIAINKGWEKVDMFSHTKEIQFKAQGKYMINVQSINNANIFVDDTLRTITVFISNPEIDIELLPEEYKINDREGFFTPFNFEIAPESFIALETQAKDDMYNKLRSDEYMIEARNAAVKSMEESIMKLTNERYDMIIKWVSN